MKSNRFILGAIVLSVVLALSASLTAAQGPAPQGGAQPQAAIGSAFTYQGQLLQGGNPVNGTYAMVFSLYDAASGGTMVGGPLNKSVDVTDGVFTVLLDFGSVFTGAARWLKIAVEGTTLSPRQALTAAPYALSLRPGAVIRDELTGTVLLVENTVSSSGIAVHGKGPNAVMGDSSTPGYAAVMGRNSATTGEGEGVYGSSPSPNGRGVYGHATATTGNARGVYGHSDATFGVGVYGTGGDTGVYGEGEDEGVLGVGPTGVRGQTNTSTGYGVQGYAAGTGASRAVFGHSYAVDGWAGYFHSIGGNGVNIISAATKIGLSVSGGTKNAVVATDEGYRLLYTEESTEVWFTDYGFDQLTDGSATVAIDPLYAQTVNLDVPYLVFVTPQGDCGLYVTDKTATSFTVHALNGETCSVAFDYRIVAKRLGFEGDRLEPAPWADEDPYLSLNLGAVEPRGRRPRGSRR